MDARDRQTRSELLSGVQVRPIAPEEQARWKTLMKQEHYLGFRSLVGETMYYVATYEGHWVALLGWGSAALHCHVRDAWLGWPEFIKYQRLQWRVL